VFNRCFDIHLGDRVNSHLALDLTPFPKDLYDKHKNMGYERLFKGEEYFIINGFFRPKKDCMITIEDAFDMGFVAAIDKTIYKIALTSMQINESKRKELRNHIVNFLESEIPLSPEKFENEDAIQFMWDLDKTNIVFEVGEFKTALYLTWGDFMRLNPKPRGILDRLSDAFA
jgi:hypothetical protein